MKEIIGLLIGLVLFNQLEAQHLCVNEIMTVNSVIAADDGNTYPWIEVLNNTDKPQILSQFYLSSDSSNLTVWALPAVDLAPDSLALIWLSGKGKTNHSSFEINLNADYLLLTNGTRILDYIPLKSMAKNQSYGIRGGQGFNLERVYFILNHDITPGKPNTDPGPWVKVQDKASFQIGDAGYYGCLVYDDKMWILDYETLEPDESAWINLVEVWNSTNGVDWKLVNVNPPYKHGAMTTVFNGYMWAFDGNAYRSKDGIKWEMVSSATPQSERVAVHDGSLWILERQSIFRSDDGIVWEKVVQKVPWYDRTWPAFMEHDGKLWVFGGNTNYKTAYDLYYSDVWNSSDGINWHLVNYRAPWRSTFWFTYASFDGKIWMIDGGWNYWDRMDPYNGNGNEIWYSEDGVSWNKSAAPTPWLNRHAQFTWVFKDELWIGAGYAGGGRHHLYNDIWKYSRKPRYFEMPSEITATYGVTVPVGTPGSEIDYSVADISVATIKNDTLIPTKAGTTTIVLSQGGDDFYKSAKKEIELTVEKKDLMVKPANSEATFGKPADIFLEYSGFAFHDDIDALNQPPAIEDIPDAYSPIGSYDLSLTGGYDDNYNFVFEKGILTIVASEEDLLLFPNPVNHTFYIVLPTVMEGTVAIEIYNNMGLLIDRTIESNFQKRQFDVSSLRPGTYIVKISSATQNYIKKIVKM